MKEKMISVKILGKQREYPYGTPYSKIVEDFQGSTRYPIVLVMKDKKLCELHKKLKKDGELEFITLADEIGHKTYKRSASLLLLKAVYHVGGHDRIRKVTLHFSVGSGYYYTIDGDVEITPEFLAQVKAYMLELAERKIPIRKRSVGTGEAIEIFHRHHMYDKEKLFHFRRGSRVNIYSLEDFEDYFYGYMVNHTGYLKYFELYPYDQGLVLQLPEREDPQSVPPFKPWTKLFQVQKESASWGEMIGAVTVGDLNEQISKKGANELILIAEALQESKISQIADRISNDRTRKFVMIAETPLDEEGNYNFECLEAIDVKQFNEDMTALLRGEEVSMPSFNFKTGQREYRGDLLQLGPDDVLVIEGIHCLNDKLSFSLPAESKFRIYISALTQLNID